MTTPSGFDGFPRESINFFLELRQNNNKVWFETHKDDFENYVMTPARDFVDLMGATLKNISPGIHAEPQVNRSIFRIHRDTRFSKDKTPYKTHLGIWIWEGNRPKLECSGYYFHLEPPNLMLGVGIHMFTDSLLKVYRDSVVHSAHGPALVKAIKVVSAKGSYLLGGQHYKKVPQGYDSNHENAEFLLYNGLTAGLETPIPEELFSEKIINYCFQRFKEMSPIHNWLLGMTERISTHI